MDSKELAELFGVHTQTILYWRKYKNLPWYEIPREEFGTRKCVRFKMKKVRAWAFENGIKIKGNRK